MKQQPRGTHVITNASAMNHDSEFELYVQIKCLGGGIVLEMSYGGTMQSNIYECNCTCL